ncbi:hypothetical protein EB809_11495 [Marinobacter sp. R17]|uniref:hypothetical protein n=1 Tax=Marinobacter sp. R17 TaxID=2484250 RepID=UPI000F4C4807|nr:hypothetical protein [Marinobacter sp. R17]ROT99260.1 hypothetical protein EB809_11495 [Marinobacter sp. R17]
MARVTVHIGYPKAMSTSLQNGFFNAHPDIQHMGVGEGSRIDYASEDIEFIFEVLLKYARRDVFDERKEAARRAINDRLDAWKLNVFSSEHLSMNFSLQGIDPVEKFERLRFLLTGHEVTIVAITRDKDSFLRSIYGEFVRMGYCESFDFFQRMLVALEDRSFYRDLDYARKEAMARAYFDRVRFVSFESLTALSEEHLPRRLCQLFEVSETVDLELPNAYPGLSPDEVDRLRRDNRDSHREMSRGIMEPFERHRNRTVLSPHFSEPEVFENVLEKRAALERLARRR